MTPEFEETRRRTAEGVRQAQERFAALTSEVRTLVETKLAEFDSRLVRSFVGEEGKKKGYMPGLTATFEEMREFRKTHPATHKWVAFEQKVLG